MRPIRSHRLPALAGTACMLTLMSCSSSDTPIAPTPVAASFTESVNSSVTTGPVSEASPSTTAVTIDPTTAATPPTSVPEVAVTPDQITAALEINPTQFGGAFAVAPPDAPEMVTELEHTRVDTAAGTESCASMQVLTATPDFSRVYATPSADVVTVHAFVVDPTADAPAVFDDLAGNVDRLAECLLAIGSAGLDTFFGAGNPTGITGGTQRLVGSVVPPADLMADGAVAFDSKTDLEGATPFTIDGKFIVFRINGLVVTIEGSSPADASAPADQAALVVAQHLATIVGS